MAELRLDGGSAGLNVNASCKKIGLLIKESGLSDKELAGMLGLTVQSVNKWRHGHHLPDVENLYRLSRILKRNIEEFLVSPFPVHMDWSGDVSPEWICRMGRRNCGMWNDSCRRMQKYYTGLSGGAD